MEYHVDWLLKRSRFEFFGDGKYAIFWAKTWMKVWYLLISEKNLFWTFWEWERWSFFDPKSWWKDDIYWLLKSSCFELFGDGKYGPFWAKKFMERRFFTWSFLVFHDITGVGKYGFSFSVNWTIWKRTVLNTLLNCFFC